jgi:signal transduction histidine kinase
MELLAPRSVQQKLVGLVLVATLAAILVAIVAMIAYDLRLYHTSWVADLETQAELIARTSAPALAFDDSRVAQENLELLRYRPKVRAAALYDSRGRLFARFAPDPELRFPDLPKADGVGFEGDDLVVFKRIVNDREVLGTVYLRADYELNNRLLGYLGIAAVVLVAAMLVAYFLSRVLQAVVTRPLLAITDVAREVTEKRNFSLRAQKLSRDEIGMLAEGFNTMLAEMERLHAELEQRVRERTAQLEYTNRELEAFCYSVSHDLRAPLRAIDGFSQALLEDFPKEMPEEAQRFLSRIRSSTQRMGQLIEDLLNLSQVSRVGLERREIDITEIAKQVAADLRGREPGRRIEISIGEGLRAEGDPRLLRAAIENLVGNAWKFTSKTEQPRVEIGALREGAPATFFVRDNGAGFDMAYAAKLFGAFQRLHSNADYPGTGIGLATVQRIMHRHGGRIWADATPGKGAAFFFTLEPDA